MKKLLFVLLTAALALPMTAQVKGQELGYRTGKTAAPAITKIERSKMVVANRDEVPAGYASVTLAAEDVWGDGTGYQMLLDADATAYGTIIPETGGLTTSGDAPAGVYDEFEYKIPENADGSLYTTNIIIDDAVTILIPAGVYDYAITNPTPGDRLWIASSNGSIPGRYDDFEFVDGGIYTFYVTFGGSNDQVDLEMFDPLAPVMPVNVTADENGNVAWENDHDPAFNLRYRPYDPDMAVSLYWDSETDLEDWYIYDADGDGYNWGLYDVGDGVHGYAFSSASYENYEGLYPDNWLFTPVVPAGGTLSFWGGQYSSYYLEQFAVCWIPGDIDWENAEIEEVEAYIAGAQIIGDELVPEYGGTTYEYDLSGYRGEGRIAFRHYGTYDEWRLFIDDVTYNIPGNEPGEWIVVEGIEGNEFAIEGLEDGVTYEVQVQAIGEDGRTTDWTNPVQFTYEEGGVTPPPVDPHMTGKWLVLIDRDGNENWYAMNDDPNGENNWFVMMTLHHSPWNEYVPFFFMVDGVQMGAESNMYEPAYGEESQTILNPVFEGENMFIVPSTYTYTWGLQLKDGQYYLLIAQGPQTSVNEINGGKTVAGVRYYNMAGQEMQEANGMTIVVTTYTDGTTSAAKVIK